ncbi:MAG: cyclic nucleotide-binding domain-containing protein [Acidimicrobiales bacterium]
MRIVQSVTSVSWIPSEAIGGVMRMPFDKGFTHYDEPPPESIGAGGSGLEALQEADRFRFANHLRAWIEVEGGAITGYGYAGGGSMGSTTVRLPGVAHAFQAVGLPDVQQPAEVGDGWVRFTQTAGGRTGLPAPRRVRRKPFIQWQAPLVWTTLALTMRADGSSSFEVAGASHFPRHWIYNDGGDLTAKVGLTDFKDWYRRSFGKHTPWGDEESPALVTAVESALERALSTRVMRGGVKPKVRKLKAGALLAQEGARGEELYLVLDGVVRVEKGGERLAEYGPGALLGERAVLEGGIRTSTMVAVTACRVAVAAADDIDREALVELSADHRREDAPG